MISTFLNWSLCMHMRKVKTVCFSSVWPLLSHVWLNISLQGFMVEMNVASPNLNPIVLRTEANFGAPIQPMFWREHQEATSNNDIVVIILKTGEYLQCLEYCMNPYDLLNLEKTYQITTKTVRCLNGSVGCCWWHCGCCCFVLSSPTCRAWDQSWKFHVC